MNPDFDRDTAVARVSEGRYDAEIRRTWWVGRGPNGGAIAALALRAATVEIDEPARKPRSMTVHFLSAPAEGPVEILATVERAGGRASTCLVRVQQDGAPVALALTVFASGGTSQRSYEHLRAPSVSPPDALQPVPKRVDRMPEAMQNYEYRLALGSPPFSGAGNPAAGMWIRTAIPRRPDPISIAAFSDAWTPMPFIQLEEPAPAPTLELTIHFRDHHWYERAATDSFVLAVFDSRLLHDGFFEENGNLWSEEGVLLAQSRQLAMLIED